jgi:hypothetical protein
MEIQLTEGGYDVLYPIVVRDLIIKKEVEIPLYGCRWRYNYQEGGYNSINRFDPATFLDFQRHMLLFFCAKWLQVRGGSSFCRCWWNC